MEGLPTIRALSARNIVGQQDNKLIGYALGKPSLADGYPNKRPDVLPLVPLLGLGGIYRPESISNAFIYSMCHLYAVLTWIALRARLIPEVF